jgi:hypothetical protein
MQHITNSILATLLFGFTLKQKHFFQIFFHHNAKIPPKTKVDSKSRKKIYCQNSTKMNFEKQNNYSTYKCQTRRGTSVFDGWFWSGNTPFFLVELVTLPPSCGKHFHT